MTCRLFGTNPLSDPILTYYIGRFEINLLEIWIKILNFRNAFENVVCKMQARSNNDKLGKHVLHKL